MQHQPPPPSEATPVEDDGFVTMDMSAALAKTPARARGSKPAAQPSKAERQIGAWQSEKDQIESRLRALEAQRITREEEAIAAIRQIEAERDADIATIEAEIDQDGIVLSGVTAAIEAAVKAQGRPDVEMAA